MRRNMLQTKMLYSVFLTLVMLSCSTSNPNNILNPNKAAQLSYKNMIEKVTKLSMTKDPNRKVIVEGVQSAFKLEKLTMSGRKYTNHEYAITFVPENTEINYWEKWFESNKKFIEWDYVRGEITVNYLYKDSICSPK